MLLARLVDAGIPFEVTRHDPPPLLHGPPRRLVDPCTGARWRKSPTGPSSRPLRRGTCPSQVLAALGKVGGSRQIDPSRQSTTSWRNWTSWTVQGRVWVRDSIWSECGL